MHASQGALKLTCVAHFKQSVAWITCCKCQLLTWLCLSSPACWTPVELAERGLRDTGARRPCVYPQPKKCDPEREKICLPVTWSNATYCGAVKTPGCKGPRGPSLGDSADSTRAQPRCCRRGPWSVNGGLLCTRSHTAYKSRLGAVCPDL